MRYNGDRLYGELRFGLYGEEDIDFEASKEEIQKGFEAEYGEAIKKRLYDCGIEFVKFDYYSPRYYNYATDSLDLEIKVVDVKKLLVALEQKKELIEKMLADNKSYDGYIATTADSYEQVIEEIKNGDLNIDILALKALLSDIDFSDFDIYGYMVREDIEEDN